MSKIKINVGRVKAGLATKKLTNEAAADQAGISRSSFGKILKEGRCAAFMLGKIARVLDIPVWELVDK
jgi:predicted DNA-binding protein (UPF0251 family)